MAATPQNPPATHRCAMPALRTAQEMAFTAVPRALSSVVSSPVPLAFRPSSITKRVMVTTLVSKAPRSDMAADDLSGSPSVDAGPTGAGLKCSATWNSVKRREPILICGRGVALLETQPALWKLGWPVMKWYYQQEDVSKIKDLTQTFYCAKPAVYLLCFLADSVNEQFPHA